MIRKKSWLAFIILSVLIVSMGCKGDLWTVEVEQNYRSTFGYVVPIAVINEKGKIVAAANSIMLDWDEGYLVSNAHITVVGPKYRIKIFDEWFIAETKEEWINWDADIAIFQSFGRYADKYLPEAKLLEKSEYPAAGSRVTVLSYMTRGFDVNGQLILEIRNMQAGLLLTEISYAIDRLSTMEVVRLRLAQLEKEEILKEDQRKLYEDYLLLYTKDEIARGQSGSPAVFEGGVIGILSSSTGHKTLTIPSYEIKALLNKVEGVY